MDKDERFKHIATDPKFRRIPKSERKVKIDKRFQSMFSDEKFKQKYTVDKRGRPVNHTSTEDLKRYYELNSDEESSESSEENTALKTPKEESSDLKLKQKSDKVLPDKIKNKLKDLSVDYARGEGAVATDSSSDDEESEEEFSDSGVDHGWGEFDKDTEKTEEATKRIAVCNQDWDRIRALDIMVLFNSFVPSGSVIHSVTIYPSDFGLQRMKEEEVRGPTELIKQSDGESDNEETEEGSRYHMEKLRRYQLNRLKYYYAVVTCDTSETANKIYTECDGMEYESSATKIDLRFVPDDMEFENKPKEICEKMPEKYEPRFFTTTALQQAKVELTWDETNPERLEITKKFASGKIDDVTEADLQAYLASSSEEESEAEEKISNDNEDEDTKTPIDKYRALLQDIEDNEKQKDNKGVEMEISWGINSKEKTEKLVKKKLAEKEDRTPFQQYLDKRKDTIKNKREERKKKSKNQEQNSDEDDSDIPSDIDMNDSYFAEEFDKPEFKKKKSKTKKHDEPEESEKEKAELELLLLNENEDSRKHFSLKKIQLQESDKTKKNKNKRKKGKEEPKRDEDDFELDVTDDRFSALYSSHHYNIDPTDSRYKKTKGMTALIEEKIKRRENEEAPAKKKPKKDAELNVLVKSIKRKTQALGSKK